MKFNINEIMASLRKKIYSIIKTNLPFILTVFIPMLFLSCDKTDKDNYIAPCGKIINCHACDVDPSIEKVQMTEYEYEYNADGYPVKVNSETEYVYE